MKVWKRILIKLIILLAVVLISGGGAAFYQAYRQSSAEDAMERYLACLIDNDQKMAYDFLDQSEDGELSREQYQEALSAKKYSLYASYELKEVNERRDSQGREYVDYQVTFLNLDGEKKAEETLTAKKQKDAVYGIFEHWKVLSNHCLVKEFYLTAAADSEVYLNGQLADSSMIRNEDGENAKDTYLFENMIPGSYEAVIRHPVLEAIEAEVNTESERVDYTEQVQWKPSAKAACEELGIQYLKALYTSAVKEKKQDSESVMKYAEKMSEKLITQQAEKFHADGITFKSAAISGFQAEFSAPEFSEKENELKTEMTLRYHYVVKQDVERETDETDEEGTPILEKETVTATGDAQAAMTIVYQDGTWKITAVKMDLIPGQEN